MAVCTTILPAASADECAVNGVFGEISRIYFTRHSTVDELADATDAAEWETRLSNSTALSASNVAAAIRYLYGKGELVEPEQTTIPASLDREVYSPAKFTVNFTVDDTSATNYSFASSLVAANGQLFKCWMYNDGYLFGGDAGFAATMRARFIIPKEKTALRTIEISLVWTDTMPTMATSAFIPTPA